MLSFLPARLRQELKRELKIAAQRLRYARETRARLSKLSACRVNVGCGRRPAEGWINLDLFRSQDVYFWDCRHGLPFQNNSVAAIYSEHAFEHFEVESEAKPFLRECLRCLMPGGVLRLVVPDAGAYLESYGKDWEAFARMRPLQRVETGWRDSWLGAVYSTQMQFINAVFRQGNQHKYAYDAETLVAMIIEAGFTNAQQKQYGDSRDPLMLSDRLDRSTESLYVEGLK
jgi:predicted SAM-dependent methyltransferase